MISQERVEQDGSVPDEIDAIKDRYSRRNIVADKSWYNPLDAHFLLNRQERERGFARFLREAALEPVSERRVLEVGCGSGSNLIDLIRLGFQPSNLVGNELREDRLADARARLPVSVTMLAGDAAALDLEEGSFDVVLQSTVFTSILDDAFQEKLAGRMWSLVRPRGGILWYDFTWNNPNNPDVRGVTVRRIRQLFPEGIHRHRRTTLAPPIGRRLGRFASSLYPILNSLPFLRTHVMCWIGKPEKSQRA